MERFGPDGHLTDEALSALAGGGELEELARLELAQGRGLAGVSLWPQDRLYRPGLHMLQSRCSGEKLS